MSGALFVCMAYTGEVSREPPRVRQAGQRPAQDVAAKRRRPEGVSPAKPDESILPPSASSRSTPLASRRVANATLSRARPAPTSLSPLSFPIPNSSPRSPPSQASEAKPGAPLQSRPHTNPPTPPTKKMSTIHPHPPIKLPKINHPSPPLPCLLSTIPIHCAESGRRNPAQKAADPQQNSPRLNLPGSGA